MTLPNKAKAASVAMLLLFTLSLESSNQFLTVTTYDQYDPEINAVTLWDERKQDIYRCGTMICGTMSFIAVDKIGPDGRFSCGGTITRIHLCNSQVSYPLNPALPEVPDLIEYSKQVIVITNPIFGQVALPCETSEIGIVGWSDIDVVLSCDECDVPPAKLLDLECLLACWETETRCKDHFTGMVPYVEFFSDIKLLLDDGCRFNKEMNEGNLPTAEFWFDRACFHTNMIMTEIVGVIVEYLGIKMEPPEWTITAAESVMNSAICLQEQLSLDEESEWNIYSDMYYTLMLELRAERIDVINLLYKGPINVEIYDEQGNVLSKESEFGIPGGIYLDFEDRGMVFIVNPPENYRIETKGTSKGTYDIFIEVTSQGGIIASNEYRNVKVSKGEIDTYELYISPEGKGEIKRVRSLNTILYLVIVLATVIALIYIYWRRRPE